MATQPGNLLWAIVALFVITCQAHASIFAPSYSPSIMFADGTVNQTTMTMAFDGTNYLSANGGGPGGVRLASYDAAGTLLNTYSPGVDFRSIFTDASGTVFARGFNSQTILKQTSPGVFSASGVVLSTAPDSQSSVVLNGSYTQYIAQNSGSVSRWDLAGNALSSVSLIGWGSVAGETNFPFSRGIAAVGNFWLTYNGAGILSAWDAGGNRVGQTTLIGAGTSNDSAFSFSYANGKVFIIDGPAGTWLGYDIVPSDGTPTAVPEVASFGVWGVLSVLGIALVRSGRLPNTLAS